MKPRPFETMFVVDPATGCWLWKRVSSAHGYGRLTVDGQRVMAHRYSYEIHVGPIPPGLTLDHLCRNRACVNPEHLEAVTNRENILRGVSPPAARAKQTHCFLGHEFTPENTMGGYPSWSEGQRRCRTCHNRRAREFKARSKAS